MPKTSNLTSQRFGRLVAITATEKRVNSNVIWHCVCDCGKAAFSQATHLLSGRRVSCGCAKIAGTQIRKKQPRHGHCIESKSTPTYRTWSGMQSRCFNKNVPGYKHYGGRGIIVCKRWQTFENFLHDMGEKPAGLSIDRIDVNGNYEPANCRWATNKEQSQNKRNTRLVLNNGVFVMASDISKSLGGERHLVGERLAAGWNHKDATTKPLMTKSQIAAQRNKKRWS